MTRILLVVCITLSLLVPMAAQQQNSPGASLVFAGTQGPPYPIIVDWSSTVMGMTVAGGSNAPYLLVKAPILVGAVSLPGLGSLDVDPSQIQFVFDGIFMSTGTIFDSFANTGPTGTSSWTFPIATNGTLGGFQAAVTDPSVAGGILLSAASRVTINVAQNLFLAVPGGGDDVFVQVPLAFGSVDFYDQNYTEIYPNSNGSITFGSGDATPIFNNAAYDSGLPRMAPLWTDLIPGIAIAQGNFVMTVLENLNGFTVRWVSMNNYSNPIPGPSAPLVPANNNTFAVNYDYASGGITFDYTTAEGTFNPPIPGSVQASWGISGITPGGNLATTNGVPDYTVDLLTLPIPGPGLTSANPLDGYRTDINNFPAATMSGTGVTVTITPVVFNGAGAGVANTYSLF